MKKLPIYQIHRCASILGEVTTIYYISFDELKQRLEELTKKGYAITEIYSAGYRNIVDIEYTPSVPLRNRLKPLRELHFVNKDDNSQYHYHILFDHHYGTNDQKEFLDVIGYYNGLNCLMNDVSIEHGKDGTCITVYIKTKSEDDDVTTCYKKHEKYYNDIIKALSFNNRLKTLPKVFFIDENDNIVLNPSIEIYQFGPGLTKETVKERRQKFFDAIYQEYRINGLRDCVSYQYRKDKATIELVFCRGETKGSLSLDQLYKDVADLCKPFEE